MIGVRIIYEALCRRNEMLICEMSVWVSATATALDNKCRWGHYSASDGLARDHDGYDCRVGQS